MRILFLPLLFANLAFAEEIPAYDRDEWKFSTYKYPEGTVGFFTGSNECLITVEHVVSINDAHVSGGWAWDNETKFHFANDKGNHIPTCLSQNSSKNNLTPSEWYERSTDGRGVEVDWRPGVFCAYVELYHDAKVKWGLNFDNNDPDTFLECGVEI